MPTLETDRLTLSLLLPRHAAAFAALVDEEIARNTLTFTYPYPLDQAIERLVKSGQDAAANRGYSFGIFRKGEATLMGNIGIYRHLEKPKSEAGVGYWIGAAYRGAGYMTEALRRVIQFGFEEMGVDTIYADYFTRNPASRRVMEKAGMTLVTVMQGRYLKDGDLLDAGLCRITRGDDV